MALDLDLQPYLSKYALLCSLLHLLQLAVGLPKQPTLSTQNPVDPVLVQQEKMKSWEATVLQFCMGESCRIRKIKPQDRKRTGQVQPSCSSTCTCPDCEMRNAGCEMQAPFFFFANPGASQALTGRTGRTEQQRTKTLEAEALPRIEERQGTPSTRRGRPLQ